MKSKTVSEMKKRIFSLYHKAWLISVDFRNSIRSKGRIFEDIYHKGWWGDKESVSGSGSSLKNAKKIIQFIPAIVRDYQISKILDIPCGDFNWMKEVDLGSVQYFGADIVGDLVEENTKKYANKQRSFFQADLTDSPLPEADLIICRDCLVHLSNHEIFRALENIRNSRAKYLVTTTFSKHQNKDITTGNWRPVNLMAHPFNLPEPLYLLVEECLESEEQYLDKALGLWNVSDIPADYKGEKAIR
jgi:hypothetical protein